MQTQADKACYKILLNSSVASKDKLDAVLKKQNGKESFAECVIREGLIKENELLDLYAKNVGTESISLRNLEVDKSLIDRIPVKFAWYYRLFPVSLKGRKLTIAVDRLLDVNTLDEVRFGLGFDVETVFSTGQEIEEMLKEHYGVGAQTVDKIISKTPTAAEKKPEDLPSHEKEEDIEEDTDNASVIQLVNQIILDGYRKRASDIHIEPYKGKVNIRYRIDGVLHEAKIPDEMNQFLVPILSRFKIMANLNIVEKRLPQDGKARVKVQDQSLDLRVASLPTPHGESIVIRILTNKPDLSLEELGFAEDQLDQFRELMERPNGVLFVTGPTGSGKSTTLYGALKTINTVERKVITIEDPIEYEMPGITQIQVIPEIGLTFAQGLRSMLRHDPDVMMVGEVRDLETADIAIRASLTGHLMLSTLHTNDAASGITRLVDIGVEPYLISSSVVGFLAQRLVRVICPACKEKNPDVLPEVKQMICDDLQLKSDEDVVVYRGKGCSECYQSGFTGRLAIHEILVLNEEIRKLIFQSASSEEIKGKARELGMRTLRQDGWQKVLKGLTTPEEIIHVAPVDEVHIPTVAPTDEGAEHRVAAELMEATVEDMVEDSKEEKSDSAEPSGKERRKYARVNVQMKIIFRNVEIEGMTDDTHDSSSRWDGEGITVNLSAGGIAYVTDTELFPGDLLDLSIKLNESDKPIECIGKALRVRTVPAKDGGDKKNFLVAVLFLAIHSMDRSQIENFVTSRMGDEAV